MSGFVVDSRTLVAVSDTLDRLHDQLVGMHTVIWHQWGTLGGQSLETELEHFCGTWHYGVSELGGQLKDLTRRLGEAAAAYERIEQRITQAGGGPGSAGAGGAGLPTGSGHSSTARTTPPPSTRAPAITRPSTPTPAPLGRRGQELLRRRPHRPGGGASHAGGDKHPGGDKHSKGDRHPGVGSGTTVIGGGPDHSGGSHGAGHHRPTGGSGSGTTIIGGGPTQSNSSRGGSGTTTIDEKIHHSEERQRAELAAVLKMVKD